MRIIYLLLLTLPLLITSFEVSPTCPAQTFSSKCHKHSYISALFKPETSSLKNTSSNISLYNATNSSTKSPIKVQKLPYNSKVGSLERSRSFSKKHSSGGIVNFFKNIPNTVSQYTSTFIYKVKGMPKVLSDSIVTVWIKFKHFLVTDVPNGINRIIQKIKGLPDSLPKDLSGIEQTIKGIPQTINGNIKMIGDKLKRMMTLKTVNGTTVLREKLNMISNAWDKAEQKILEKFKHMQNTVGNTVKNLKERIIRTFNQIINIWIKFKESVVEVIKTIFSSLKVRWLQVVICSLAIAWIFIGMRKRNRREQGANPR